MCSSCGRQVPEPEEFRELGKIAQVPTMKEDLFLKANPGEPATEIGQLYRKAKNNFVDSVRLLIECGDQLKAQKEKLSHGEWLPWLQKNAHVLGFGSRTAQLLMDAASRPFSTKAKLSTSYLDGAEALAISRQIWGNREPESEREPASNDIEMEPEPEFPEQQEVESE